MTGVRRGVLGLSAAVLPLLGLPVVAPAAQAVVTCATVAHEVQVESVVGVPGRAVDDQGAAGSVDLYFAGGGGQILVRDQFAGLSPTGPSTTGDRFGASVAVGDVNGDGCADLAVGAPGEGGGAVHLLFGSTTGIRASGAVTLTSGSGDPAEAFGSSVVMAARPSSSLTDLYVGAPRADVSSVVDAGLLYHFTLDANGAPTLSDTVSQNDGAGIAAEADDLFGERLAAARYGVVVGVPHEDEGTATDAGVVMRVTLDHGTGHLSGIVAWSESSPGVPGTPQAGDRFGASVATSATGSGPTVAGIPGEDVGGAVDAGAVQVFSDGAGETLVPGAQYTQSSAGVPGVAMAKDAFGSAVAVGRGFICTGDVGLAVGAPGDDVKTVVDAGTVTLIDVGVTVCPAETHYQGAAGQLFGAPEKGDAVGSSLGVVRGDDTLGSNAVDVLDVGAPKEDSGAGPLALVDAGLVMGWYPTYVVSYGFQGGAVAGQRYGAVFATPLVG